MSRHGWHFRLAHELGKHLHEVLGWPGPMTRRQMLVWQAWLLEKHEAEQGKTSAPSSGQEAPRPLTPEELKAAGEVRKRMFLADHPDAEVVTITKTQAAADKQHAAKGLHERGKRERQRLDAEKAGCQPQNKKGGCSDGRRS